MSDFIQKLQTIFEQGYICDHCLGRQFAKSLTGFSNDKRGEILRTTFAIFLDSQDEYDNVKLSNFHSLKFHSEKFSKIEIPQPKTCFICNNFFKKIDNWIGKITKKLSDIEFNSFLVGTILSSNLLDREESLWETIGVDSCEPIKAEINREVGKRLEKKLKVKANLKNPDINIILDIQNNTIKIQINPLFIYGEYQKLVRNIPQTKWPSLKYKTSVEQIIGKPIIKITKGKQYKLHGCGREDIDARCLAWRPFIIEITYPKKRFLNLRNLEKEINKSNKIKVRKIKLSEIIEVRKLKELRLDKTYKTTVECDKEITKKDLMKIKLPLIINQRTPTRVLHRRTNKMRKRRIKSIKIKNIDKKTFQLIIRCEAGLYIKEFVSGDNGRTRPNISSILGCKCLAKDLDVIKIHKGFSFVR